MNPLERATLALAGLSVGDAFGERFFGPPAQVAAALEARRLPPAPWRWTDDTAMACCVLATLKTHKEIDADGLARRLAREFRRDGERGYGRGAREVLSEIARGVKWRDATSALFEGQGSLGNGAAMRVAPVGAWFAGDMDRVVQQARLSAVVTHSHPEGQAGAIAVAVAAAQACGQPAKGRSLLEVAERFTPEGRVRQGLRAALELPLKQSVAEAAHVLGNGTDVTAADTVPFSLWCAARHHRDYPEALWATVSGLGDRDTTCAIVGGIVALSAAVPPQWEAARERLPL